MNLDVLPALGWFAAAYLGATLVGIGHTCFNWLVLKVENREPVQSVYDIVAYEKTVPYHPIYNIVLWPLAAYPYLNAMPQSELIGAAVALGVFWCLLTVIVDLVGWVVIRHPWSMSRREMYVDYQPWVTLIYLSILVSPSLTAVFLQVR